MYVNEYLFVYKLVTSDKTPQLKDPDAMNSAHKGKEWKKISADQQERNSRGE